MLALVGLVIAIEGIAMLALSLLGTGMAGQMAKELEQQAELFGSDPETVSLFRTVQLGLIGFAAYNVFKAIVGIGCVFVGWKATRK